MITSLYLDAFRQLAEKIKYQCRLYQQPAQISTPKAKIF
jgi:hypothetical protein